jgi:NADPH:quinone reductase-like Zn-dependent oxidoreductase
MLVLESDFPDPTPGEGDVVLRVCAASLNYHDVFTRRGMPGIKVPMPAIMGLDVAGAIGAGVEGWHLGDRVLVDPINRIEGGLIARRCMAVSPNCAAPALTGSSASPTASITPMPRHCPSPTAPHCA